MQPIRHPGVTTLGGGNGSGNGGDAAAKAKAAAAQSCMTALSRISKSYLGSASAEQQQQFSAGPFPGVAPLHPAAAAAAASTARSLLALIESDVVVAHRETAAGLARLVSSGRAGRAAVVRGALGGSGLGYEGLGGGVYS